MATRKVEHKLVVARRLDRGVRILYGYDGKESIDLPFGAIRYLEEMLNDMYLHSTINQLTNQWEEIQSE